MSKTATHNPIDRSEIRACDFLKQALQEKLKKNAAYSLRAAARDLGVTPGYMSLVLNGKKRLGFKRAVQFAQFLHMHEAQTGLFLKAVALESMKDSTCRSFLQNTLNDHASDSSNKTTADEYALLEIDRFRILSEWYHIAILDLTLLEQFKPKADWVAGELGISIDLVNTAVARLERLGLLEVKKGKWKKTSAKLVVPTTYSERAVREFHEQMIDKARESLASSSVEDFAAREISGITIAVDPARVPEAKQKIDHFKREMLTFMGNGKCTALYQMNVQLFQLNQSKNRKQNLKGVKK